MSKNIKKIMVTGAALLMFASVGASASNVNVNARHVRSKRVAKVNRKRRNKKQVKVNKRAKKNSKRSKKNKKNVKADKKHPKRNKKNKRPKLNKKNQRRNNKKKRNTRVTKKNKHQVKNLINRAKNKNKKNRKNRNAKKNSHFLKSKFRRSNNPKLLKQSGFYDGVDGNIISRYAPNNPKAVIAKFVKLNKITRWIKSRDFQKNPTVYNHILKGHNRNEWQQVNK